MKKKISIVQKKEKIIIAFDFDDTLIHSELDAAIYTGFSPDRWVAFCEILSQELAKRNKKVIFIGVTFKTINEKTDRLIEEDKDFTPPLVTADDPEAEFDIVTETILKDLAEYIPHSQAYFTQGQKKSTALKHAAERFGVRPENIFILDDQEGVVENVTKKGFNAFHVPPIMYQVSFSDWKRESACIQFITEILAHFKVAPSHYTELYQIITQRVLHIPTLRFTQFNKVYFDTRLALPIEQKPQHPTGGNPLTLFKRKRKFSAPETDSQTLLLDQVDIDPLEHNLENDFNFSATETLIPSSTNQTFFYERDTKPEGQKKINPFKTKESADLILTF